MKLEQIDERLNSLRHMEYDVNVGSEIDRLEQLKSMPYKPELKVDNKPLIVKIPNPFKEYGFKDIFEAQEFVKGLKKKRKKK